MPLEPGGGRRGCRTPKRDECRDERQEEGRRGRLGWARSQGRSSPSKAGEQAARAQLIPSLDPTGPGAEFRPLLHTRASGEAGPVQE